MTVVVSAPSGSAAPSPSPSAVSLSGLDRINFFDAGMQAAFGPYVAVYLADQKWMQEEIGFVLTAGTVAGLLSQLPGGELVDSVRSKRALIALGAAVVAISAIVIDLWPTLPSVLIGLILQGSIGGVLGLAIAAISLGLIGLPHLPERLGRNQRFASVGSLAATALMGLVAYFLSYRVLFAMAAILSLPMFAALARIRSGDIHLGRCSGAPDHHATNPPPRVPRRSLWGNSALVTFAATVFLLSTRECLDTAAGRGSPRVPRRRPLLAHHLGSDHLAADCRCGGSTLGRPTSATLGPPSAAANRPRCFA